MLDMNLFPRCLLRAVFGLLLSIAATLPAHALQFGDFTYTATAAAATITGYTGAGGVVIIPGTINSLPVTGIGSSAFQSKTTLTSVTIPNSVTSIEQQAFSDCTGLTSVTIPNGVTILGYSAFSFCTKLASVTIGSGVTSIGQQAFSGCTGLTSVTIPNSVTSIGNFAFSGCTGLTSVTIPNSVTSIEQQTFSNCNGLTSVTIPSSVTSIGSGAFQNCTALTSVTIPNSVTSIGSGAFENCFGLTSVTIGTGVTSIGNSAFYFCIKLASVTIPNSVSSIGNSAFYGCTGLTSVTIGSGVTSIGQQAFSVCTGLTSVTFPNSVTSIWDNAFQNCNGLTSVTIPNSVISIGQQAFSGCTGLTSVTIGSGVTSIGNSAFQNCYGLTSVAVDPLNAVYSSADGALFNKNMTTLIQCPGGKAGSYTIPSSVTSIGQQAFSGCTGLTSVTIPNSVTSIGNFAFSGCTGLITVYIKGNAPSLGTTVFTANPKSNVYYLLGTTGWTSTYGGLSTVALGLPTITGQPSNVIANAGENAAFSVIAKTTFPLTLTYQWQRNGLVIPSATAASLYFDNIQSANVGTYTVIITNDAGSVSSTVTLTLTQGTLYTQAQYDSALQNGLTAGIAVGRAQVTDSPNSYGLYSLAQVQALHVGTPLLAKDQVSGKFKLTIAAKKSADLSIYTALPFSAGDATINALGEMEFQFTSPDNAAFFRLETH